MSQLFTLTVVNIAFTGIGVFVVVYWLHDLTKIIIEQQVYLEHIHAKIDELRAHLGNYEDELAQVRSYYEAEKENSNTENWTKDEKAS